MSAILNDKEMEIIISFKHIIIWGYPLYSHTQSYVHYGFYKAFKSIHPSVSWFTDENYPKDLDYSNCLFIAEGYADKNIPILSSSVYIVNFAINPLKYLEKGARLLDLRLNVLEIHDCNYDYVLPTNEPLSKYTMYERLKDTSGVQKKCPVTDASYEAIYMFWATDLLPDEINLEWASLPRETIYII